MTPVSVPCPRAKVDYARLWFDRLLQKPSAITRLWLEDPFSDFTAAV